MVMQCCAVLCKCSLELCDYKNTYCRCDEAQSEMERRMQMSKAKEKKEDALLRRCEHRQCNGENLADHCSCWQRKSVIYRVCQLVENGSSEEKIKTCHGKSTVKVLTVRVSWMSSIECNQAKRDDCLSADWQCSNEKSGRVEINSEKLKAAMWKRVMSSLDETTADVEEQLTRLDSWKIKAVGKKSNREDKSGRRYDGTDSAGDGKWMKMEEVNSVQRC